MCCTKLSCLLLVVAQKSSRSITSFSVLTRPSAPVIIVLLFLPKGGLASTTSKRSPGSEASASATTMGTDLSLPMPCSIMFIAARRAVLCTSSQPRRACSFRCFFCSRVRLGLCSATWLCAANRKPPVPQAGSQMVSPGLGAMQSTMAWISGRGVKYWPAPLLVSCAFFSSRPS